MVNVEVTRRNRGQNRKSVLKEFFSRKSEDKVKLAKGKKEGVLEGVTIL